jgi:hypothetical protein
VYNEAKKMNINKKILEMNTMKQEKRFEIIHEEKLGIIKNVFILRDKQTGEQYLFVQNGYAGGLSPLLNEKQK